jgi:hypothetical protein
MVVHHGESFVLNLGHPARGRARRAGPGVATGDVLGRGATKRTVLVVSVEDWMVDALAALGAGDENREPEPDEDDDLAGPD